MSVDLTELIARTYSDFSGGLNEDVSTYNVDDNQVIAAKNVRFASTGEIRTRLGESNYGTAAASGIVQAVRGMHRYVNSDGTRNFWIYSGTQSAGVDVTGKVYQDDDAGTWTEKTTLLTNDGYLRFKQYKDALLMGTDRYGQRAVYGQQSGTDIWFNPSWAVGVGKHPFVVTAGTDNNAFQKFTNYIWRYTYDIYIGDTFIMETSPIFARIFDSNGQFSPWYWQDVQGVTSNSAESFEFTKNTSPASSGIQTGLINDADPSLGGAIIKRINIYRATRYLDDTNGTTRNKDIPDFFYIGSVEADDWDAAASDDTVFVDDGISIGAGSTELQYGGLIWPPYGRFIEYHKNRMWLAYTTTVPNAKSDNPATSDLEIEPSRLYYSEFGARGPQLLTYKPYNYIDIAPDDGEPITGIVSSKDNTLLVFKPNSIWAIRGGDTFVGSTNQPAIRKTAVSTDIGCIAPETIQPMENGILFLSNRGVYVTDGNSRPVSIDNRRVRQQVVNITPSRKYYAATGYDSKEKEIWVAYSHEDTGGNFNRSVNVFSTENLNWTRYELPAGAGISVFGRKQSLSEEAQFYAGRDDNLGNVLLNVPVARFNNSFTDRAGSTISWSVQTKFYDLDQPHMTKDFQAVLVQAKTISALTLHVLCDNRLDTRSDAGGGFTIPLPVDSDVLVWGSGNWDEKNWGINREGLSLTRLDDRIWGHRISLIISGTNNTDPASIQAITFFYKPKENVRFNT